MFDAYLRHGWKLCRIEPGTKGPTTKGWNARANAITDPATMLPGAGLCHAYSGTCALDIDEYGTARGYLLEHGINLDELMLAPDSVQISSGRVGRAKLLYALPTPLASLKLAVYEKFDPIVGKNKKYHAFELRCATGEGATVQDVLPPTIHPDTQRPYVWKYADELIGDWRTLPPLPPALEALWRDHLKPTIHAAGPVAAVGAEFAELEKLLNQQDPDAEHDTWLKWGMAVHHEAKGSNAAFELWNQWSAKSTKYPGRDVLFGRWRSFRSDAQNPVTIGSLRRESVASASDFSVRRDGPETGAADGGSVSGPAGVGVDSAGDIGEDTRPDAVMQRLVGDHVVYVRTLDAYFDKRDHVIYPSDRAVRNAFCPVIPLFKKEDAKGNMKAYSPDPVSWLMRSQARKDQDVHSIAMHPGKPVVFEERGKRYANSYNGNSRNCAVNPAVVALPPRPCEREAFEFLWSRITSPVFASWLKKFYAYALKHPGVKIRSAPLLVSETTGTGKTTLMNEIPRLLFGHVEQLTESQIRGTHNGELLRAWWATIEEVYAGNTKAERRYVADKVKPWITNEDLMIRMMHTDAFSIINRVQFTASSNHPDAIQLENDEERRWGVCGVKEAQWTEGESLGVYHDFLNNERAPGVLKHIFQQESLTGFNPSGKPPITSSKTMMVAASMGQWESAILERIVAKEAPFHRDVFRLRDVKEQVVGLGNVSMHSIARLLRKAPFNCKMILSGMREERFWCWRNYEHWRRVTEKARIQYVETGTFPPGQWSTDIPRAILAMSAEGPVDDDCDLI